MTPAVSGIAAYAIPPASAKIATAAITTRLPPGARVAFTLTSLSSRRTRRPSRQDRLSGRSARFKSAASRPEALPAASFEQLRRVQRGGGDPDHRLAEPGGNVREH